jgi:hypothetical protein
MNSKKSPSIHNRRSPIAVTVAATIGAGCGGGIVLFMKSPLYRGGMAMLVGAVFALFVDVMIAILLRMGVLRRRPLLRSIVLGDAVLVLGYPIGALFWVVTSVIEDGLHGAPGHSLAGIGPMTAAIAACSGCLGGTLTILRGRFVPRAAVTLMIVTVVLGVLFSVLQNGSLAAGATVFVVSGCVMTFGASGYWLSSD